MSIIKNINESLNKLRNLISEAPTEKRAAYDTDKNRARAARNNITDPSEAVSRSLQSAISYADRLSTSDKMRANNIIINTLRKGAAGCVDATFIRDLDTRWLGGTRVSLDSANTIAYDYIIQMLAAAYNMPEGKSLKVGEQEIPIQSGMKENAFGGLSRMFDLQDKSARWRWFIFGSQRYSTVPSAYRPKVSTLPDGKLNFAEVDKYIEDLNFILKSGKLAEMLKKRDFYDKGFAYVLTAVRNKYLDMKRVESKKGNRNTYAHDYTDDALPGSDPTMLGLRGNEIRRNMDTTFDTNDVNRRDNGENPGHNSPKHFVNALKVNIKGDADVSVQETYGLADYVVDHICKFVDDKFGQAPVSHGYPVIPDLFRAVMTREPSSLNFICRDEKYKDIYPNAYAAYLGKPANYAQITYNNWEKKYMLPLVKPEMERATKEYIDQMELDMEDPTMPVHKDKSGQEYASIDFSSPEAKEKATYGDYEDPRYKTKRVNAITKRPESFLDADDYWNSLEENEVEGGDKKQEMFDAVMNTFMQLTAPK